MSILNIIFNKRKKQFRALYKKDDASLPLERESPVVDFFNQKDLFIIGEQAKASPFQEVCRAFKHKNIMEQYYNAGIRNFAVLTEKDYFKGSIIDLYEFKNKYPKCAFLRKDFLFCKQDIEISYRAGADAILLISEVLSKAQLGTLIREAQKYKLQTLCAVSDKKELAKLLSCGATPTAISVGCIDLRTLKMDYTIPLRLKPYIPKGIKTIFDSGMKSSFLAYLAGNAGFDAVLVGEGLIDKREQIIKDILIDFKKGQKEPANFFTKFFEKKQKRYIKVCGITNTEDAIEAVKSGADCLGFIIAPSKRNINIDDIEKFKNIKVLKVAVVVDAGEEELKKLKEHIKKGIIDAVQFHGNESIETIEDFGGNAYKVISIKTKSDIEKSKGYIPIVLFDTPKDLTSEKGVKMSNIFLTQVKGLWIAGGIDKKNIKSIIESVKPVLIDICSGVELTPGRKDHMLMAQVIKMVKE